MNLIKLHFIGFVDDNAGVPKEGPYIDLVLYDESFIDADKITAVKRYICCDDDYAIPVLLESSFKDDDDTGKYSMLIDNYLDYKSLGEIKDCSIVFFDKSYAQFLNKQVLDNSPHHLSSAGLGTCGFIIYESPAEIQALIKGCEAPMRLQRGGGSFN